MTSTLFTLHLFCALGYDWSKFIEYVVRELEGDTTEGAVERREKEMREKIKEIISCDGSKFDSFFEEAYQNRQYDIVQTSRCFESILDSGEAYQQAIVKLASYVKPGGYLQIITAIGENLYTCAGVDYNLYALNVKTEDVLNGVEMAGEYFRVDRVSSRNFVTIQWNL